MGYADNEHEIRRDLEVIAGATAGDWRQDAVDPRYIRHDYSYQTIGSVNLRSEDAAFIVRAKRRWHAAIEELQDKAESLEFLRDYWSPIGARPCPACVFDNGVFQRSCQLHRRIEVLETELAAERDEVAYKALVLKTVTRDRDEQAAEIERMRRNIAEINAIQRHRAELEALRVSRGNVNAIWLCLEGNDVVVRIEATKGVWVEVIRERADGCYSHIIEPRGIEEAIAKHSRKVPT